MEICFFREVCKSNGDAFPSERVNLADAKLAQGMGQLSHGCELKGRGCSLLYGVEAALGRVSAQDINVIPCFGLPELPSQGCFCSRELWW